LGSTFFGLTSEYKLDLHKLLFTLIYYSNGGFTYTEVYNMPVYLRTFYLKQLEEAKKQEADAVKSANKGKPSKR
jgi:hypothetical protein